MDPNGREIVIKGEDGSLNTYVPGQQCSSSDKMVQTVWANLNKIYDTEAGKTVIGEMTQENSPTFTLTNESLKNDGTGRFKKDGQGGGTIYMAGHLSISGEMSHELFHGYQEMKGQGGISIHNEVEANLFAMITTGFSTPLQPKDDPQLETDYGKSYKAFFLKRVTASNFDNYFDALKKGFIDHSRVNYNKDYSDFPTGDNNKSLLKKFFK